jgi:hypothetical protein
VHIIWCAAFTVAGFLRWQGLVFNRNREHRDLIGVFAFVFLICLFGAVQSIVLPLVRLYSCKGVQHTTKYAKEVSNWTISVCLQFTR